MSLQPETLRPIARNLLRTYQVRSARSRALAEALATGSQASWESNEEICSEGAPSESMFVLLTGSIRVTRKDVSGEERELAVIPSPSIIGQMGLVDGSNRSATCTSLEKSRTINISRENYNTLMAEATPAGSAFRHLLLSTMMGQLSSANQRIRDLITDMEQEQRQEQLRQTQDELPLPEEPTAPAEPKESSTDRLLRIAGVLEGWDVQADGIDDADIQLYEDEDMKRTREAAKRRW